MTSFDHTMKSCKNSTPEAILGHKRRKTNESMFTSPVCAEEPEPAFDWIEEEMAKVCGEGVKGSGDYSSPSRHVPLLSVPGICELPKSSLQTTYFQPDNFSSEEVKPPLCNTHKDELSNKELKTTCDWHLLRLKHEADLEKRLKRVEETGGAEKRAQLERRFLELFGPDESSIKLTIGTNQEKKERDEIAALTVKHLMPLYKKQRIASRDLFKKLAKHISDHLLEKLSSPGENDVQSRVQEFFRGGKAVHSEADISS